MKHYFSPLFCALVTVGTSFLSVGQEPKVFEKLLFLELDAQRDSVLFMNYSNAWSDSWRYMDKDLSCQGSELMNEAAYKKSFDKRKENLYTLIHPKVLDGSLTLYSPYDPIMFGLNGFVQR